MHICLLRKEKKETSGIKKYLEGVPYSIEEISCDEKDFFQSITKSDADIIIFDVGDSKGGETDTEVLKQLHTTVPVLLVTNSNETSIYREKMLDAGVDSCIQSPFLQEELLLRLKKLAIKKDTLLFFGTRIVVDGITIDIRNHTVTEEGEQISLTKTEYRILLHLLLHKDTIVSTKELILCLDEDIKEDSLALTTHIFNLRKKIKDVHFIKTVPLYGFTVSNSLNF
jgi:DNA-binding response OmpR family regulator